MTPATSYQSYQYAVQARDSAGSASEYTTPVLATTACAPPAGLVVTGVCSNSVAMAWTAPTDCAVSSYDVFRNGSQIGSATTTSFTDTTVAPGTAYQYAVRAHDSQLASEGYAIRQENVARLSPLVFDHINLLGRYAFSVPESAARG